MAFFDVLQFYVYQPFFVLVYCKHTCITFGNELFLSPFGVGIPPPNQEIVTLLVDLY